MTIFVTGGAGFIGSNFILYWLKKYPDDKIINFDSLTYAGNLENLKSVEKNQNYLFIHGDISDYSGVFSAMDGVDIVVHFAAETHVDRSIIDPFQFVKTNVLGTQVLLNAAYKKGIKRFHHISTDEVFGTLTIENNQKFFEKTAYNPRSPYSASKAASDHLVRAYYHTYELPISITNCSNNYGPFQFPEKFIPLAITNLLEGKTVPVYGDGKYIRDWLYVDDHCSAIECVLRKGKIGETYCVGGLNDEINNISIIKKILSILGKEESSIVFVKDRPGHDRRYAVDWTKISRELGWKPKYDIDTYLRITVDWYKEHKDWWEKIKSGTYKQYYNKQYEQNET